MCSNTAGKGAGSRLHSSIPQPPWRTQQRRLLSKGLLGLVSPGFISRLTPVRSNLPPFLPSYLLLGLQDLLVHRRHKNGPAVMIHAVKLYFAQRHLFIQLQPAKGTALGSQICPWFLPSCQSCSHAY